ncbi:MAG: LacI family DNA-binding transcriptional regulator [Ramlibacter sp.]
MATLTRATGSARSVTIRDVAARAHASAGTVSRVLNGAPIGKEAVRRRVEAAIHELQYVPNAQARALSSKAFHTIAAVIPSIRNLNFVIFVRALQEALAREGYTLLFSAHEFDLGLELEEVRTFLARGLDGVVLVGQEHLPELYAVLAQRHCPYVTTWTLPREPDGDCVGVDNFDAAARLTRYLLDLGHREFAVVASLPPANDRNALRLQGVKAELRRAGIALPDDRILEGAGSIEEGKGAIRQLAAWPRRPTVVICVNDFLAFGALLECQALGIAVPAEMSIAGFGDIQFASDTQPPLTTVRMPAADIGRFAAESLLRAIGRGKGGEHAPTVLKLEAPLVVRGSTGRARA